jgi:hypothetical protein
MAITLQRQLSNDEKAIVLSRDGRLDWVTGREIPEGDVLHFDHIQPWSRHGETELNNIAPLSQETNLRKGRLSLAEFKTKLRIERFFDTGERLTLGHLLRHLASKGELSFGEPLKITEDGGVITLQTDRLKEYSFHVQKCPATGWRYFYATLPVNLLDSDDDADERIGLQPRFLIFDKVFSLYRHFLVHPVLQPSIGRVDGQRIRIFDGQHKIAGLIFAGRKEFETKIYLEADLRLLNQTNISAHDSFAQTRFFSSVMVMKLGAQFGRDFEDYRSEDDNKPKTESAFLAWLSAKENFQVTQGNLKKRLRSFLYNSILEDPSNKLRQYVSVENRSNKRTPLTMDQLEKSIFSHFLYREPVDEDMATDSYLREPEFANVVYLMNALHNNAMHRWETDAPKDSHEQVGLSRMFGSKSMMAWSELLHGAITAKLNLYDSAERARPFYRSLTDEQRETVAWVIRRLTTWKGWQAPANADIDRHLADNVGALREWFKSQGLNSGYLMGAPD